MLLDAPTLIELWVCVAAVVGAVVVVAVLVVVLQLGSPTRAIAVKARVSKFCFMLKVLYSYYLVLLKMMEVLTNGVFEYFIALATHSIFFGLLGEKS